MNFDHDLEAQHERIRVLTDRLTLLCRSDPSCLPVARWLPVIEYDLHALYDGLTQHFAFEERGGYMSEILKRDPNQKARAEELMNEHARMRESFANLLTELGPQVDRSQFQSRLGALLDTLHEHETAEVDFLQSGLIRDVGVGD